MGLSLESSNKVFGVVGLLFQIWFIVLYAIDYEYWFFSNPTDAVREVINFQDIQGYLMLVFLFLLFFLGFSLVNTYVAGSAYSSMLYSFMVVVMTIQYYFIIRSFWIGVGLANDDYHSTLAEGKFSLIRILSTDYRLNSSYNQNVGMTEAVACAISILVAYMAVAGRVAGFHVLLLTFFGVFFYSFNETVIWRHAVADNGHTMRVFLYGSTLGIISGLILKSGDKVATTDTDGYFASRHTRTTALLGASFVWIFLPIMAGIEQIYDPNRDESQITYLNPAMMNMWFALSASASISFCISILLGRKIHPHDIVFSSFTGGIAFGATSNLNADPFPALLAGLMIGTITTLMNHKLKKPLNNPEVTDTQGILFTFFIASLFGGFYSACLTAVGPFGADVVAVNSNNLVWSEDTTLRWFGVTNSTARDRFEQGGFQVLGTVVSAAIGLLCGLAVGFLYRITASLETAEVFNDAAFAEVGDDGDEFLSPQPEEYGRSNIGRSRVV